MHISLYLIWFHEIHVKYVKMKQPRTIIKKWHVPMFAVSPCCWNWSTCFPWKDYSHRRLFFSQIILQEIKAGSFSIEFRCSCAINKFKTSTLCGRTFNYSTEHLKIPGNYTMYNYLLTTEKKSVIFSGSRQMQQRNIILSQGTCKSLPEYLILSGCFEISLPFIPRKKANS